MMYATVALGIMAAAASTAAAEEVTGRQLSGFEFGKFKGFGSDDKFDKEDKKSGKKKDKKLKISDGDEGDEGNEGFKFFKSSGLDNDDEGNEGDEGDEGDEHDENDEGDEADIGKNTSDAGKNDHNEGDEGDEGGFKKKVKTGGTKNFAKCVAVTSASAWSAAKNAHVSAIAEAYDIACHPKFGDLYKIKDVSGIMDAAAFAAAEAVAAAAAKCESSGNAFGCAAAKSQASAWAAATAEAHAEAWAYAYNNCGCKKPNTHLLTESGLEVVANTFIQLSADVYASAEVEVCVKGDQVSSAAAFSKCWALAHAKVWTQAIAVALTKGKCFKTQLGFTLAEAVTGAEYLLIEDCDAKDGAKGNAGSTTGGGAQATATELDLDEH